MCIPITMSLFYVLIALTHLISQVLSSMLNIIKMSSEADSVDMLKYAFTSYTIENQFPTKIVKWNTNQSDIHIRIAAVPSIYMLKHLKYLNLLWKHLLISIITALAYNYPTQLWIKYHRIPKCLAFMSKRTVYWDYTILKAMR